MRGSRTSSSVRPHAPSTLAAVVVASASKAATGCALGTPQSRQKLRQRLPVALPGNPSDTTDLNPPMPTPPDSRDEAFWQKQQKRREKQMGQPCCTQSGMSWTMIDMPGNFAVVIHGEFDCVNCFHHHIGRSAVNYYSTRLTEEHLTNGRTEGPLRECLALIAKEQAPEIVIVLGTCPVEVIGDQFGPVVEDMSRKTGIPMIAIRTSGLALSSQKQMLDWLFRTLATLPEAPPVDRRWQREVALLSMEALFEHHASNTGIAALKARFGGLASTPEADPLRVNLIGTPGTGGVVPEPIVVLAGAGIEVNGQYPEGASITEWRAIRHATHSFVVDTGMFPRLMKVLAGHGQSLHEIPLPIGLSGSLAFYESVGVASGRTTEIREAIAPWVAPAQASVGAFVAEHGGLRLAVAIRMLNNYRTEVLAYDGLGELPALIELGFEIELLVQGPPEADAQAAFRETLDKRGCTLPFSVFPGPYALADMLRQGRYDLCVVADSSRDAAHQAGVPMLSTRELAPWLGGVEANVAHVRRALSEKPTRSAKTESRR